MPGGKNQIFTARFNNILTFGEVSVIFIVMAKGKSNFDNEQGAFRKLPPDPINSTDDVEQFGKILPLILKDGYRLLAEEEKTNKKPLESPAKKLETALGEKSNNPYIKARIQILKKYPEWKRDEVLKMEEKKNTNNRFYEEFCREVTDLGNKLSNTP